MTKKLSEAEKRASLSPLEQEMLHTLEITLFHFRTKTFEGTITAPEEELYKQIKNTINKTLQ